MMMMQQHQGAIVLLSRPPPILSSASSLTLCPSQLFRFSTPVSVSDSVSLSHSHIPNLNSCFSRLRRPVFISAAAPLIVNTAAATTKQEEDANNTEEHERDDHFIEVGYISKVHGLKGELRVKPTTDFPQLRFSEPGKRWLRTRVSGKEVISQVELTAGRDHPGQNTWIISLRGIDTVDQAKQIVGSTLLVKEGDKPELEEGEFYTSDLVGMRVVLKESGRLVGVVVNVVNYGASDLLQVMLNSTNEKVDYSNSSKPDIGASGQVVWVPFVEAIVPEVDMDKREMCITPPKGLLELNLRTDLRTKKERHQLEWKERKRLRQRFTAAKKKLSELQQEHLLECLKVGDKTQKSLLVKQIVNINFKLFQHAVQSISLPSDRFNLSEFIHANSDILQKNAFKISSKLLSCSASEENLNHELHKAGLRLLMKSKGAIVLVSKDEVDVGKDLKIDTILISKTETKLLHFQKVVLDYKGLLEVEGHGVSIPLILVSPANEFRIYEELLLDNDYFGLDHQKFWLLEEEELPIVSLSLNGQKILTKSSCEILQAPTGSGGVLSLLSSHNITDKLIEIGVEYVQICCLGEGSRPIIGSSLLFGLVKSRGADMGISMRQGEIEEEDEFNIVFSMTHLHKICKQIDILNFVPVPEQHAHVELVKVAGEYTEHIYPIPDEPNSYRLHSSIYSAINSCSLDNICIMYVT